MNPTGIIIHHSLTSDGETVSWGAIRKYHLEVKGWKDIGYHAGIELIGDQYELLMGRMENEVGAHCLGFNDDCLGICLVGNFNIGPLPEEALVLLRKYCRSRMDIYGIKLDRILGHWETFPLRNMPIHKTCPGIEFSMQEFRSKL